MIMEVIMECPAYHQNTLLTATQAISFLLLLLLTRVSVALARVDQTNEVLSRYQRMGTMEEMPGMIITHSDVLKLERALFVASDSQHRRMNASHRLLGLSVNKVIVIIEESLNSWILTCRQQYYTLKNRQVRWQDGS
ncbi:hypothetical protein F5887DRAFT_169369 [Amanita rubescens]|nr:hypothetical protein F5887DRAFT_169369 [Amanita rubescens]